MNSIKEMFESLSSRDVNYNTYFLKNYFMKNYSPKFIKLMLKVKNPFLFERFTAIIQEKKDVSEIDEKRDAIIKKLILNEENNEMLSSLSSVTPSNYEDYLFTDNEKKDIELGILKENFKDVMLNISNKWLNEYIIYYFFHDNYYNFLVNLNQVLRYLNNTKIDLIDKEHLSFYLDCYNLSKLSFKEKIQFFKNNYLKKDIQSMFYDDMRIVKNHSYHNLVGSLLKIDNAGKLYNEKLSKKYGVPVYYLNGEKFNSLVRNFTDSDNEDDEEFELYINNNQKRDYYSFSFIGDRNINCICPDSGYTLLYDDIDPELITHVYHDDSGTALAVRKNYFTTIVFNEIHTPDSLIDETNYYNELVIKKGKNGIKPSALVCYDVIDEKRLAFARKHNLPIVLINSKKYQQKNGYTNYDDCNTYVI